MDEKLVGIGLYRIIKKLKFQTNDGTEVALIRSNNLVMKMFGAVALLMISTSVLAYDSGIAVQVEKGATMHVYVNGKLYNKQPGHFLRVRSTPGLIPPGGQGFESLEQTMVCSKKRCPGGEGLRISIQDCICE